MADRRATAVKPLLPVPGGSIEELWDEIRRLRADMERIRSQRLVPKFGGIDIDNVGASTAHYPLGFEPRFIWFIMNAAASATVATFSSGCAVADDNVDGGIWQASSAIRRSASGQFRASNASNAGIFLGADSQSPTVTLHVDSFDIDGFTYTIDGTLAVTRGFAVGF